MRWRKPRKPPRLGGLDSALLNIGGNLRAIGEKANGEGTWTVGVENPWGSDPAYVQTVTPARRVQSDRQRGLPALLRV